MKFVVYLDLDSHDSKIREANQKARLWIDVNGIEYTVEDKPAFGGNGTVVTELKAKQIKYLVKTFGIEPAIYC